MTLKENSQIVHFPMYRCSWVYHPSHCLETKSDYRNLGILFISPRPGTLFTFRRTSNHLILLLIWPPKSDYPKASGNFLLPRVLFSNLLKLFWVKKSQDFTIWWSMWNPQLHITTTTPYAQEQQRVWGRRRREREVRGFVINVNLGSWSPLKRATVTTAARAESSLEWYHV